MSDLASFIDDVTSQLTDGSPESSRSAIQESLAALRALLRMEVAFVSRFGQGRRWFEFVDADETFRPFDVGDSEPLELTYCARVVDGRLPGLVRDARTVPEVAHLPVTSELPVGAHLSVPIEGPDGTLLGTLCCFSRRPDQALRDRDLELLTVFAGLISRHLGFLMAADRRSRNVVETIASVISHGGPAIALQPIVDLSTRRISGYEALSRFPRGVDDWTPDRWFREADGVGLGPELEQSAVGAAIAHLGWLPPDLSLSVNVSARALCSSESLLRLLIGAGTPRLVVELTEHAQVEDYDEVVRTLDRLRRTGIRVAVDDAGSGYAGLEHIIRLQPEVLKLDRALVEGVASHPGRQALCGALLGFTQRVGSSLVAEGVETRRDLDALACLGVPFAQGYYLGRPQIPQQPSVGANPADASCGSR